MSPPGLAPFIRSRLADLPCRRLDRSFLALPILAACLLASLVGTAANITRVTPAQLAKERAWLSESQQYDGRLVALHRRVSPGGVDCESRHRQRVDVLLEIEEDGGPLGRPVRHQVEGWFERDAPIETTSGPPRALCFNGSPQLGFTSLEQLAPGQRLHVWSEPLPPGDERLRAWSLPGGFPIRIYDNTGYLLVDDAGQDVPADERKRIWNAHFEAMRAPRPASAAPAQAAPQ